MLEKASQHFLQMIQGLIPSLVGFYTPNQVAGHRGMYNAITNHMNWLSEQLGRLVTRIEAHLNFSLMVDTLDGVASVASAGLYLERHGRNTMTMAKAAHECRIDDIGLCVMHYA